MEKKFAGLLACLLALTALFVPALGESDSFAGQWLLTSAYDAQREVWVDPSNISMSITLNGDGSAAMSSGGVEAGDLTWSAAGTSVTIEGGGAVMTLELQSDGTLALAEGDVTLFFSQAGAAGTADIVGTWMLVSAGAAGVTFDLAEMGLEQMTVTFNADGTCEAVYLGITESATWTAQDGGALVTDSLGQQSSYVLQDDGTLYTEDDGVSMIFERGEAPAAQDTQEAAQPPEGVRTDAALADFNGEWTISYATAMGMQMEPETLGLDMNLSISDGSITIAGSGEQSVYTAALENGALVFSQSGLEMPLYLYEDGTLSMTMNMGGLNVEIVFERA